MLLEIKEYLKARKQASLADLAVHFDADPASLRSMLDHFVRKGNVTKSEAPGGCAGGCAGCRCGGVLEIYQWRPKEIRPPAHN